MKNGIIEKITIAVGIIFILAIIVMVFIFNKKDVNQEEVVIDETINVDKKEIKKVEEVKDEIVEKEKLKSDEIVEESDGLANWKTYKNEKYGFEFKYPESITISSDKEELFGDDVKISLMNDTEFPILDVFVWTDKSYNELMNDPDSYSSSKLKNGMSKIIKKGDKIYELSFGFQDSPKEIAEFVNSEDYKRLLNTFKFSE